MERRFRLLGHLRREKLDADARWQRLLGLGHANGNNAFFTKADGTATIPAKKLVAVRSLTFSADGCTIDQGDAASRLALTNGGSGGPGANTIEVTQAGHIATINAAIVGNPGVGVVKTGAGTLVLGGANGYTGDTLIKAGAVVVSACSNLGASARVSLDGGDLRFAADVNLLDNHPLTLRSSGAIDTQGYRCEALTNG